MESATARLLAVAFPGLWQTDDCSATYQYSGYCDSRGQYLNHQEDLGENEEPRQ